MPDDPKIFDDFLAHHLLTGEERTFFEQNLAEPLKFFDPERAASCSDQATALAWYDCVGSGCITPGAA